MRCSNCGSKLRALRDIEIVDGEHSYICQTCGTVSRTRRGRLVIGLVIGVLGSVLVETIVGVAFGKLVAQYPTLEFVVRAAIFVVVWYGAYRYVFALHAVSAGDQFERGRQGD